MKKKLLALFATTAAAAAAVALVAHQHKASGVAAAGNKQEAGGKRGPQLYIENLPTSPQLLRAPEPQSRPVFAPPADAPTQTGPAWTAIGPFPIPNGQTEPLTNGIPSNPTPVSGRVTAIDIHPTNPDIAYVGTAQGGLYRTLNGGGTWTQLMDSAPSTFVGTPLAIGSVMINPLNSGMIFVGTGEGNLSIDSFFGSGFYIITNADSANPVVNGPYNANAAGEDVFSGRSIVAIAVDPTNANNMFVSTSSGVGGIRSSAYSVRPARGLYRTTNGLAGVNGTGTPAWQRLQITGTTTADTISTSVIMEPGNPNNLYVSFLGQVAGDPAGIYRTADALAGTPMFTLMKAVPLGAANGNSKLAASKPAGGQLVVYATTSEATNNPPANPQGQLYKSVNNGPFVNLPDANGFAGQQGFYDIAVGVDPTNPNNMAIGGNVGANIARVSNNGGTTLVARVNTLHADTHAIAYSRSSPNVVYHGNDGGIWRSNDGGQNWQHLNNSTFSATQFSDIATHPTNRNFTLAGTQDNGTPLLRADGTWFRSDFGDGGFTLIDRNTVNTTDVVMYHTYFNARTSVLGTGRTTKTPCAVEGQWSFRGIFAGDPNPVPGCDGQPTDVFNGIVITDNVNFYAPMVLGPGNPNTWYYGSDKLYRSMDRADTAQVVSQLFEQTAAGTPPVGTPVSTIAISPQDDNYRLVGLNSGKIFATTNGATAMLQIAGPGATNGPANTPASGNVTSGATIGVGRIIFDPNNKNVAYVAYTGYGTPTAPIGHFWKITNLQNLPAGSVTMTQMSNGLPDLPANAIAADPQTGPPVGGNVTDIYLGTDKGVYATRDGGATWSVYGTGFPHVSVFGLEIQNQSRVIRAATHGRGMYETFVAAQPATPLLSAVVSRKTQGSAGTFDVNMPLTGSSGVEPRRGGNGNSHTIVFTFTAPITGASAAVTSGTGSVAGTTVNGTQATVQLTGVTNGQVITLALNNVTSSTGTLSSTSVNLGFLLGDVNNDRTNNTGDATVVRNNSGRVVEGTTFRSDVNTDGTVNGGDALLTRANSGSSVPAGIGAGEIEQTGEIAQK